MSSHTLQTMPVDSIVPSKDHQVRSRLDVQGGQLQDYQLLCMAAGTVISSAPG